MPGQHSFRNTAGKALSMLEYEVFLENNRKKTEPWRLEGHRARVSQHEDPIERMGMYAVIFFARVAKEPLRKLFFDPYIRNGYEILGSGANATVLRRGGQIIKLMRYSFGKPVPYYEDLIAENMAVHPNETVPTAVRDDFRHPLYGVTSIALYQPEVFGTPLESIPQLIAKTAQDVSLFAERSLDEMVPRDVAPDVTGGGNLLVTLKTGELKLVDTVALDKPNNASVFPRNTEKLRALTHAKAGKSIRDIYPQL